MQEKSLSESDTVMQKTARHPCFHCGTGKNARMHLPIAPNCNIQCNYCVRKFDCVNESRPGVVSAVLSPDEAVDRFKRVKKAVPNLNVVGIAGPGEPLANFEEVKETLNGIRQIDPDIIFCLSTNGLMLPFYVNHIISLGITHVTVTVNSIDPAVGAKIYKHVTYLGKEYTGEEASSLLLQNQLSGIRYLSSMGVVVKVNIVLIKGINDHEIDSIVYMVKDCGCKITNIMQLIPVKGSAFESMKIISQSELNQVRKECENMLPQMYHCKQCRADAIGTLEHDISLHYSDQDPDEIKVLPVQGEMTEKKYRFAVCSKEGTLIDLHFGHTTKFLIYDYDENENPIFVEFRDAEQYCKGPENEENDGRIESIAWLLSDCNAVICMRIGEYPSMILEEKGIRIYTTYNRIELGVKEAAKMLKLKNI